MWWHTVTHGKWRGNWRMECVASTLHTTSEHDVSSITTADVHTSTASSRLNWRPRRFKWTRPFRRKTKSGFCVCAITFQLASNWRRRQAAPPRYRKLFTGVLISPQPDLLPDVFFLMVRIFRLMLVLLYI